MSVCAALFSHEVIGRSLERLTLHVIKKKSVGGGGVGWGGAFILSASGSVQGKQNIQLMPHQNSVYTQAGANWTLLSITLANNLQ